MFSQKICVDGVAKASGVRRYARRGFGVLFWAQFFEIFVCVVPLGEARQDCFSQCNAGADVV